MKGGFRDYEHVLRVTVVFAVGLLAFLVVRSLFVPEDFGQQGFYRTGALAENRVRPIRYAGRDACSDCHGDIVESRKGSRHERIACESCHGPLAWHASGEAPEKKPERPDTRATCIRCHDARAGKPKAYPQVDVTNHSLEGPCTGCHQPHHPAVS